MNCPSSMEARPGPPLIAHAEHPFCFVCSSLNPMGLALHFVTEEDESVSATFLGHPTLEGYPGLLHGGIVATLLDGAMAHCLFAHGIKALTAELQVRYHAPIATSEELTVRAWHEVSRRGLHRTRAEAIQAGRVCARAQGKFLSPP